MDSSFSAKFKRCIKVVVSFFTGEPPPPPAPAPAPPAPAPAPDTSVGTDVESSDANTNGLRINTDSMGSSQANSTSPAPNSTNTQLSAKAIRDKVKLFLPISLVPMVYLWGLNIDRERKWYCDMALGLLSVAFTTLYTGTSLANIHPTIANRLSQVGIGCTYLTYFMLVASRIPAELKMFPAICCTVCLAVDIYSSISL